MSAAPLNRRALIGGAGIAAAAVATPLAVAAVSATSLSPRFASLMRESAAAAHRFNTLPENLEVDDPAVYAAEEQRMIEASRRADRAGPTTWQQFAQWVEHISDGGESAIDDDNARRLLMHTRRLAKMEG